MPPIKKAPTPKIAAFENACLVLLCQNLDEMNRWYRRTKHPGRELGHNVMMEIFTATMNHVLVLSLEGKRWEPPLE